MTTPERSQHETTEELSLAQRLAAAESRLAESERTLASMRESERRYRQTVENAGSIILRIDAQNRITFINQFALDFFGYRLEELLGKPTIGTIIPEFESTGRDLRNLIAHITEHPEEYCTNQNENMRRDGSRVWMSWTNRPFWNEERKLVELLCVGNDITRYRRVDEALESERRMLRQLLELQEHDRRLIGYEIHDGLAQYLSGALLLFEAYPPQVERNAPDAAKTWENALQFLRRSMEEARRLVGGLRPLVLDEAGIVAGVQYLIDEARRHGETQIELAAKVSFGRLAASLENAAFRIVQEALHNALRHSQSPRVRIGLSEYQDQLQIEVRDWGTGFDSARVSSGHYGLEGIRERARLVGGGVTIESTPGKGTQVLVRLPVGEQGGAV